MAPMDQITRTGPQLGAALRRRRKHAGLSQDALAGTVKLRQATISRLESGDTGTKLGTLLDVVAALGLEIVVRRPQQGQRGGHRGYFLMARKPAHAPLNVFLNARLVGRLRRAAGGAIDFTYDPKWLAWNNTMPVSLSLPLREDRYVGEPVVAVFDNLLPDSEGLRRRIAERVRADGTDTFSLLTALGHDCVGALQFLPTAKIPALPESSPENPSMQTRLPGFSAISPRRRLASARMRISASRSRARSKRPPCCTGKTSGTSHPAPPRQRTSSSRRSGGSRTGSTSHTASRTNISA